MFSGTNISNRPPLSFSVPMFKKRVKGHRSDSFFSENKDMTEFLKYLVTRNKKFNLYLDGLKLEMLPDRIEVINKEKKSGK